MIIVFPIDFCVMKKFSKKKWLSSFQYTNSFYNVQMQKKQFESNYNPKYYS